MAEWGNLAGLNSTSTKPPRIHLTGVTTLLAEVEGKPDVRNLAYPG